jgi:hypothetical protein
MRWRGSLTPLRPQRIWINDPNPGRLVCFVLWILRYTEKTARLSCIMVHSYEEQPA